MSGFAASERHLRFNLLNYETPSAEVVSFIRAHPAYAGDLEGIAPDQVLNKELVREYFTGGR